MATHIVICVLPDARIDGYRSGALKEAKGVETVFGPFASAKKADQKAKELSLQMPGARTFCPVEVG
jgi:hypothetical protein